MPEFNSREYKLRIVWTVIVALCLAGSSYALRAQSWKNYGAGERLAFEAAKRGLQDRLAPLMTSIVEDLNRSLQLKSPAFNQGAGWRVPLPDGTLAVYALVPGKAWVTRSRYQSGTRMQVTPLVADIEAFSMENRGGGWWTLRLKARVQLDNGRREHLWFNYDFKPPAGGKP